MKKLTRISALGILVYSFITGNLSSAADLTAKQKCQSDDLFACQTYARDQNYLRKKTDLLKSLKTMCESSSPSACAQLGDELEAAGSFKQAKTVFEKACKQGGYESCHDLAFFTYGPEGSKDARRSIAKGPCEKGIAKACFDYAEIDTYFVSSKDPHYQTTDEAISYFKLACSREYAAGCLVLSTIFSNYDDLIRDGYKSGMKESEIKASEVGRSCFKGDLYICADVAKDMRLKARELDNINCRRGDIKTCGSLIEYENNFALKKKSARDLCNQHIDTACMLLSDYEMEVKNLERSKAAIDEEFKIHAIQCEQDDVWSCLYLASGFGKIKMKNEKIRKQYISKTRKIFNKGCDEGDLISCENLKFDPLKP